MTITDEMIEAANAEFDRWDTAVVSACGKQVEYHVVRGDDVGCYEIVSVHDSHASCIEASERASMRAALVAAERAAWKPESECDKTNGTEYLAKDGSIVFWHNGKANYLETAGWYDIRDDLLTARPLSVEELRPLPTPGEPDEQAS